MPSVPEYTGATITGDSITVPSNSFAGQYDAYRTDKDIAILAANSRTIGEMANLNDAGNTLMGNIATAAGSGVRLVGGQIGANDLQSSSIDDADYLAALEVAYQQYKAANPQADVIWCAPYPYNDTDLHPNYADFTADRAAVVAQARDPAVWSQFCDYPCFFADHPLFSTSPNSAQFSDTVHVNVTGYNTSYPGFRAFMDTLFTPAKVNSTTLDNATWPTSETDLGTSTPIIRYAVISGLAWTGVQMAASVTGGGSPQIRLNSGSLGTNIASQWIYNGDVISLHLTTSASADTPLSVDLTIGGETRSLTFRTAAASIYTATFDPAKKSANSVLSNSNRTFAGTDFGSPYPVRGSTGTPLGDPTGYVEFTLDLTANAYGLPLLGLTDAGYVYTGLPDLGQTAGSFSFHPASIYYAGSTTPTQVGDGSATWDSDGAVVGMLVHKASGKVWLQTATGWKPDTPTFNSDGTIASGTGIATGLTTFYFAAGQRDNSSLTVNAGASAFTFAPPANVTPGWK